MSKVSAEVWRKLAIRQDATITKLRDALGSAIGLLDNRGVTYNSIELWRKLLEPVAT